jgi:hypothetical protein
MTPYAADTLPPTMLNSRLSPEVEAFVCACEGLFSHVFTNGKLTTQEREVIQYYSIELQMQLHAMGYAIRPAPGGSP